MRIHLVILAAAFFVFQSPALAQDSGGGGVVIKIFPERQKARKASRWTLADWFKTKAKMRAQDQWLMAHTNKIPWDGSFFTGLSRRVGSVGLDLNLARLGIRFVYLKPVDWFESTPASDYAAEGFELDFQLRLLGYNIQDTALLLRAYYEHREIDTPSAVGGEYGGWAFGPELQVYFAKWLGVVGEYRYRLNRENIADRSMSLGGSQWLGSAFLELDALRLEFGYESQSLQWEGSQSLEIDDSQVFARLRFFL